MADNSEVLEAIKGVHSRVGKLDDKVEKLGTVTGELQISQARIEERLAANKTTAADLKREVRRVAGTISAAVGTAAAAAIAAAARLVGGQGGN